MDDIDAILHNAVHDSFHSDFKPNIDHILQALPILDGMRKHLEHLGAVDEEDCQNISIAMGIIIGHLEYAYPELKEKLRHQ
jgi:hypothetical protein